MTFLDRFFGLLVLCDTTSVDDPEAGVAQSAEQRFCKPQVGGSIPLASSKQANLQPGASKGMCPLRGERARGPGPLCRSR